MLKKTILLSVAFSAVVTSCSVKENDLKNAINSITPEGMKSRISVLASDDFQGRAPASAGEQKTIKYLSDQFREAGLQPANNGSYLQEVSLIKLTPVLPMKLEVSKGKEKLDFNYMQDFIGGTPQIKEKIEIKNSDLVFAGYGINSPEYSWNDFNGLDLKGKIIIVLVNDPGYATGDSSLFKGKEMTIYGRWTYKYEEAARQGATGVMIIHETGAAAYPWGVVQNSWSGPRFYLKDDELSKSNLQFQSWITTESARKIFTAAGLDYDKTIKSAAVRGFKPIDLKMQASVQFGNKIEYEKSNNVAGVLPGKERPDEYMIYSAHWDHFGINNTFKGDSILNGAVDNATGVAALIEMARAFKSLKNQQQRSVVFLSVTCEEQGLLGSRYYAENPFFPLNKTVADINIDGLNILGKTKDMTIVGLGNSELDIYAIDVLKKYGRYAAPDPGPEKGSYFRSDHFCFAKVGVPALYLGKGVDDVVHGKDWGVAESEKWITNNYHKPSDNYEPDKWNFDGMIEDIRVYFEIGYNLSNTKEFPNWKPGVVFKAARDKMMK
jgi:Zn-dependent M28 family amino/carboxypeptidase